MNIKLCFINHFPLYKCTIAVLVQNVSVQSGLLARPLVFLLADFLRMTHQNYFTPNNDFAGFSKCNINIKTHIAPLSCSDN